MEATILVVEDHTQLCELYRDILSDKGYRVLTSTSGTDALAQCRKALPSLLLLDIKLPDISGWEVLGELQKCGPGVDLPVVVVSAAEEVGGMSGRHLGCCWYLSKPVDLPELMETVRTALADSCKVPA